jgi:hypothetical protein
VVYQGRVFDPFPTEDGLAGPMDDDNFWLTLFVPIAGSTMAIAAAA